MMQSDTLIHPWEKIASMSDDETVQYLRQHVDERNLSATIKELNKGILSRDPDMRLLATHALSRLGFL